MYKFTILITALIFSSCSASRFVEPLEKDEIAVGITAGGPIIKVGEAPLPTPLSSVEVGYGLREGLTLFGGVQLTSAFFGNVHFDIGGTYKIMTQEKWKPNLSVSPSVEILWIPSDKSFKAWPVLDINAYWNYGERSNYIYVGINNYFELSQTRTLDQEQETPIVFSPQIGHVLKSKNQNWEFVSEIKILAPYLKNTYTFVPYASMTGQNGATGIYLGVRYFPQFKNQ